MKHPWLLLALCIASIANAQTSAPNRALYTYQGADREQRLIEGAKKERELMLYSTMTVNDGKAMGAAFEKKYGVKLNHWRGSAEGIVNRGVNEARARRHDVDVFETSWHRMESLHREKLLEDFESPVLRDIVPQAFPTGHRQYVADRIAFIVMGWNTNLVKREELPETYADLLHARWNGRITIEGTDVLWFAAVVKSMGEAKGLAYFKQLMSQKTQVRNSHILLANLTASGEIPFLLSAYNNNFETLKAQGAPVDWKPLQPAFGQGSAVGVAKFAPHPHAALLFAEFLLSREGQEVYKSLNRVPTNKQVDSPLNKFKYEIISPTLALDEGSKWDKLFSSLFLGGRAVQAGD